MPRGGRYEEIAEDLRRQIVTGELEGSLPTEEALGRIYQVSRPTVRRALELLRAEGKLESRRGSGWFTHRPQVVRRVASDLGPRDDDIPRGWAAACTDAGLEPDTQTSVSQRVPPKHIADLLGLDPGERVLVRARVMGTRQERRPTQLADSYIPLWVLEQAPTLELNNPGKGGMLAVLERAGFGPLRIRERVSARPPVGDEAAALGIPVGYPVLRIIRLTLSADGRVLDAQERIADADRLEQSYEFEIGS